MAFVKVLVKIPAPEQLLFLGLEFRFQLAFFHVNISLERYLFDDDLGPLLDGKLRDDIARDLCGNKRVSDFSKQIALLRIKFFNDVDIVKKERIAQYLPLFHGHFFFKVFLLHLFISRILNGFDDGKFDDLAQERCSGVRLFRHEKINAAKHSQFIEAFNGHLYIGAGKLRTLFQAYGVIDSVGLLDKQALDGKRVEFFRISNNGNACNDHQDFLNGDFHRYSEGEKLKISNIF